MFIYLLFFPCITIFQMWERFVYKYKRSVFVSLLLSVSVAAFSIAGAYLFTDKLAGIIYGRTLPPVLIGFSLAAILYLRGARSHVRYWKYALPIVWPYIPHLLAGTVLGAMNKIFITRICGTEANGLYSLAYNVGLIITIFVQSLNSAYAPWLGDHLKTREYDKITKATRPYVAFFGLIAIMVSLLAPEALYILGGEKYLAAVYVIPPIAISCVFQFVYGLYVNVEQFEKKTVGMAAATISAAVVNVVLDLVLLPHFGYISAAYATAISYAWLLAAHMRLVYKLGFKCVYDNRFNLYAIAVVSLAIVLISFIYGLPVLRWGIFSLVVLGIGYLGFRNREKLAKFIK
jgi:O-antigen/teichoic acid export membrane protein